MTFKQILYFGAAALFFTACGNKDTSVVTPSETVAAATSEFKLDYEKFTLDNGLEVILHVDKSDPIVALTTVIHAGSNREKPGRTGFAHFFEHMAFNDSENVPRGWNRKAIPDWGGQRNGGTWSDGTIYYEVVPKDAFDKILWIDSDRLGYMINTVTQAALEREKQVVKNEKRQRVDNAPYGYTGEVIRKNLYPEGHPYSWTVIGSLPDLQAATLDDLKEFYAQVYGPNNATLSIVGDIDIAETKRKVQQWFGEIPRGQDIKPLAPMPVVLAADKKLYFEDNFAKLPELRLTFPSVESYQKDEQALEVLGQIIGGSKNSVLYKQIVDTDKLAPNVSSYNNSSEIAGEFVFRVRANAGVDLDDIYQSLQTALQTFEETGVDAKDLQRIKAEQETILYSRVSTVLGKSNQLARDNEFARDPVFAITAAKRLNAVTADDVLAVYDKYIKGKPAVITSFVPKGQSALAVENSKLAEVWIEEVKSGAANEEVSQGAEADYEKTVTKFDRSEPPFGELPLVKMPDIWEAQLPNDVPLLGIENSETPLVNFDITINAGANSLEVEKTKGKVMLLARLMNEGTASKTPAEFEQAVGLLGSGINVSGGTEGFRINGTCLAKNFEATIALVEEILMQPRFEQADFDRVKSATLTSIKGREANPNSISRIAHTKLVYGASHPLGLPVTGTAPSVEALTLDDLKTTHSLFSDIDARIHIAGDISKARAVKAFTPIAKHLNKGDFVAPSYEIPAQNFAGKVFFIDVPGSKQSVLSIGRLGVSATHPDYNRINFTNEKFGGGISGDLAQTLRIEKGYTYGAYSSMGTALTPQVLQIGTSVRANATQASLDVIKDMLINYGKDFDADDAELTQKKLIKESTRAFESLGAKLATLRRISKYGKSKKYVEEDQKELINMTVDDYKMTAAQYLNEAEMIYVVVGDKETQFEPVQAFASENNKGTVTELDIYGNILE